mmetsp:Transcript_9077/g.14540  ORF Transcript_9077/g.14540 Transcript_9077/m.14540 type:complete len:383 (+) Transcript_9077:212-1360(+)
MASVVFKLRLLFVVMAMVLPSLLLIFLSVSSPIVPQDLLGDIFESESGLEVNRDDGIRRHIVVAHCTEDLSWLDQLHAYDPSVCEHTEIHIMSKCRQPIDLKEVLPLIQICTTLHRERNCGTEEYAYVRYIMDRYDSLPPMVAFIQGGAITENPHVIYDMMEYIPGTTFKGLSRHVRTAWHFEKSKDNATQGIVSMAFSHVKERKTWLAPWRGMFAASQDQIRRLPWLVYADIESKLRDKKCLSRNCNMEVYFGPLFGCVPYLYHRLTNNNYTDCTSGVLNDTSLPVFEQDYMKDSCSFGSNSECNNGVSTETSWRRCGNDIIFFSGSKVNGELTCVGGVDETTEEAILHFYKEIVNGETWRPNISNSTIFGKRSQWTYIKY